MCSGGTGGGGGAAAGPVGTLAMDFGILSSKDNLSMLNPGGGGGVFAAPRPYNGWYEEEEMGGIASPLVFWDSFKVVATGAVWTGTAAPPLSSGAPDSDPLTSDWSGGALDE